MPPHNDSLKSILARSSEITIRVTGRKSGRTISNPIWFVAEGETLYLLPVQGTATQWYKNILQNPSIRIAAGSTESQVQAVPITDSHTVTSIIEKFRAKYGPADVKKYYSNPNVALRIDLSSTHH
jgi:deazaflavin-dependent oxidoreductase (nitroreductase family)